MIEVLEEQFSAEMPAEEKINRIREFLQILILKIIYDKDYFKHLAFVGGTALRILYNTRRFSEDLDFSLINKKGYNFSDIIHKIKREIKLYNLDVETKTKDSKTVQNALLKFSGLLKALGLSRLDEQKLSIRIEIDSNPLKGWQLENTLINKAYILNILHLNLPSLYATKLHACFFRKFTKGRDFYDLIWYIGEKIEPNYNLLNNAIKQTEGYDLKLDANNFKQFLIKKLENINFKAARKDVERFLVDKNELRLLDFEIIKSSLK